MKDLLKAPRIQMRNISSRKISLLASIIRHEFPDSEDSEVLSIIADFTGEAYDAAATCTDRDTRKQAFKVLSVQEQVYDWSREMAKLKQEDVRESSTSEGKSKDKGTAADALVKLQPLHKNVTLNFEMINMQFSAFYPGGTPNKHVIHRCAGPGADCKSLREALVLCVDFLWAQHDKKGRDAWLGQRDEPKGQQFKLRPGQGPQHPPPRFGINKKHSSMPSQKVVLKSLGPCDYNYCHSEA
jgi:hypothetical protein